MSKLQILIGFGVGYVLGARAGRERYDQIAGQAQRVWRDPRVQHRATQAQEALGDKASEAASAMGEKAAQAASAVQETAKEKLSGSDSGSGQAAGSPSPGTNGAPGAAPTR